MIACNFCENGDEGCPVYCYTLRQCELAGVENISQSGWEPWMDEAAIDPDAPEPDPDRDWEDILWRFDFLTTSLFRLEWQTLDRLEDLSRNLKARP